MLRRISALLLTTALLLSVPSAVAVGSSYSDVPSNDWSVSAIQKATEYKLMEGMGDGQFGYGRFMDRASFVTVLCRMFAWTPITPTAPSFIDCQPDDWYFSAVETALLNGVLEPGVSFRPKDDISREDMAVMLVRALDYDQLAKDRQNAPLPFPDVTQNRGYISVAYDMGIVSGIEESGRLFFYPTRSAPREQAAAMLVRVYEKCNAKIDFLHGFYAFSSYNQISMTQAMDAVSVGWARMDVDPATGPFLNSTKSGGNEWVPPQQAALATDFFKKNATPYNLNVFASTFDAVTLPTGAATNDVAVILGTQQARTQAIQALVAAVPAYAGITIDFEGMKAPMKADFTAFMTALRQALPKDKTLYVCVPPTDWFDGFDYRALGAVCDKVILMAHDYQWSSIPAYYVGTNKTDCPTTPLPKIYAALQAITDPKTGVEDKGKIALAISIASTGFQVDDKGLLVNQTFYSPGPTTLISRLRQNDTQRGWSDVYRNAYLYYHNEKGERYRVWYEDAQGVMEKVKLAHMFGVDGVSLWRIGNIPNYDDPGLNYDVWSALLANR